MPVAVKKKSFWREGWPWLAAAALVLVTYLVVWNTAFQDFLAGWGYEPTAAVAEIETELSLTDEGRRIFRAVRPELEAAGTFYEHCYQGGEEYNVLGCYAPSDDRIYVYEVDLETLDTANSATMAHELLHAVWERLDEGKRATLTAALEKVAAERKAELGDDTLGYYSDENLATELFARAGTELLDLPEVLEQAYGRIFRDRAQIVALYTAYRAPFVKLQNEMAELRAQIMRVKDEIEAGRLAYQTRYTTLSAQIRQFNNCASTAGCFRSDAEFSRRRSALEQEQTALENLRVALNQQIDENNARIDRYNELDEELGSLNNALDAKLELDEGVEEEV